MDFNAVSEKFIEMTLSYGPKLVLAIVTLIIGLWIIGMIVKSTNKLMKKRETDESLRSFLLSLLAILLKAMLVISVAGMVGIEMTSFIAVLGAAGLAVGMALSGTLQNFAGGVMILIFKPFKVGDFVEAQGYAGVIKEIQIFNTIMKTGDNKTIIIPNAPLSTGSMVNYSTEENRRVDFIFGIGYEDDIDKTKEVLNRLIESENRIMKEPAPFIAVKELADSSVNFVVRTWVKAGDYWPVYFDMTEKVKKEFDKEGISIPYPQTDVHLHQIQKS